MPLVLPYHSPRSKTIQQVAIICFGNAAAYFDFMIYLYMADLISSTFFPVTDDPVLFKLQALGLFAAGYVARPIGGLLIGRYGDIKGRKPALLISISLLSATTLITACLPTYSQAGIIAPILFVTARILQGVAFGAHAPLGWVFVAEHVNKFNVATYCSLVTASFMVGGVASSMFFEFLTNSYTPQQLSSYGWRIPFVVGTVLSLITLLLWHKLEETPLFLAKKQSRSYIPKYTHISLSIRKVNAIVLACLITFVISSLVVVIGLILPDLILLRFSVDQYLLNFSNDIGLLFITLGCIFYGLLADKNSIGKSMMLGAMTLIVSILAFYYHLTSGNGQFILITYAILGFSTGIIGVGTVVLVKLFPTRHRLSAVAITYNVTYALVGGVLPFALVYATKIVSFSPGLYIIFVGIVAFIIGMYLYRLPQFKDLDAANIYQAPKPNQPFK